MRDKTVKVAVNILLSTRMAFVSVSLDCEKQVRKTLESIDGISSIKTTNNYNHEVVLTCFLSDRIGKDDIDRLLAIPEQFNS